MAIALDLRSISMDENTKYELMYRRPGAEEHENITKVLDDIILRLRALEEEVDLNPGLTD
jgi:hypothetical protein